MPYRCVKCGKLIEDGEEAVWIRYQRYHLNCHYSDSREED
jgi:DNA-directed RNA polymerase subunit RPC12/RpoP